MSSSPNLLELLQVPSVLELVRCVEALASTREAEWVALAEISRGPSPRMASSTAHRAMRRAVEMGILRVRRRPRRRGGRGRLVVALVGSDAASSA